MTGSGKISPLQHLGDSELQSIHGGGGGGSKPGYRYFTPYKAITHTTEMGHAEAPASIRERELERRRAEIRRLRELGDRQERLRDPHYHLPQFKNGR